MDNLMFGKKILSQLLVMVFITGCMPSSMPTSQLASQSGNQNCPSGSNCAVDGNPESLDESNIPPKVEIRHLIEPNLTTDPTYSTGTGYAGGGSYVRKLTLPKNFAGKLYLAGINIGTLTSRHVKVRFKFGVNKEVVEIPATVAQAPGITPQTEVSVLVMDLRSEPFRRVRLPYDLFDYNEYPTNPIDNTFLPGVEPVQNNRDQGLYCRGLTVADDPTFQGVGACDGLQTGSGQPEEECLYAYAKVLDQGLIKVSGGVKVPLMPSFPQIKSTGGSNYFQDAMAQKLLKPLPDIIPTNSSVPFIFTSFRFSDAAFPSGSSDSEAINFSGWGPVNFLGSDFYYRGPYRLVNSLDWQFRFYELDGEKKLFRKNSWVAYDPITNGPLPDDNQISPMMFRLYYQSYLFPLATKLDLTANVAHISSSSPDGVRSEPSSLPAGKTLWMDGSNARAQSINAQAEHIGSCNVSATIEIIANDDNGTPYIVSLANDVKLQLVRPTQYQASTGLDVLSPNFKSCNSNAGCGSSECCFNNRCWDQNLVSQCYDSSSIQGNRTVGESCGSDLECSSLCCNSTSGQCAPHNTITTPAVLCSKPIGAYCIAKEWCQKTTVVKCLVVKTGVDTQGNTTCNQLCYNTQEYGDCKNGTCVPPVQPTIPTFDPNAPGACANAVPAPNF